MWPAIAAAILGTVAVASVVHARNLRVAASARRASETEGEKVSINATVTVASLVFSRKWSLAEAGTPFSGGTAEHTRSMSARIEDASKAPARSSLAM